MLALRTNQELFSVRSELRGRAVQLHLSGELDAATAPVLEAWFSEAERSGDTDIVVDLENLTFVDSGGLRALQRAGGRARRDGRSFGVVNAPAVVRRVMQLTETTYLLGREIA